MSFMSDSFLETEKTRRGAFQSFSDSLTIALEWAMVRPKTTAAAKTSRNGRLSNTERSAYFARREAAKVLRLVLQGDARRRAVGSIKSLVYSPSVRNKKATFALVCQTLKRKFMFKTLNSFSCIFLFCSLALVFFFICIQISLSLKRSWSLLVYWIADGR